MALCAISQVVPVEPVVSTKSGHVFEKKLIEKQIEMTGTCPVTQQPLSLSDLIPLQVPKVGKPRPPTATSIPSMIQIMQNEWDSLMLETYTLKKHLEDVRQELAHALYQHDAACRVIARLMKERDAARNALADTQANMGAAVNQTGAAAPASRSAAMDTAEDQGMSASVSAKMEATAKELSANRKKNVKAAAARILPKEKVPTFAKWSSHTPHSASKPGITALDVRPSNSDLVLTGGVDTNAVVFNQKSGQIVDTLKAHKKAITAVKFHPDPASGMAFSTSQDGTAIVWKQHDDGKYAVAHTLREHKASVVGVTVHPSGAFFITASADSSWNFYDTASGSLRQSVLDEKVSGGYSRVTFHPDGLILGTGATDALVRIFDVRAQKNVATFKGHAGSISDLVFSENGYYLASADVKGVVKLWDLRKLENLYTMSPNTTAGAVDANNLKGVKSVHALDFDLSGTYLVAGTDKDVRIYNTTKSWELLHTLSDHTSDVTGVRFGVDAGTVISCSLDRSLKVYGPTA